MFVFVTNPYRPTYPLKPHGNVPLLFSSCNCSTHHLNQVFSLKKSIVRGHFFTAALLLFLTTLQKQKKKIFDYCRRTAHIGHSAVLVERYF